MPFGFVLQVQTQEQEDKIIDGIVKAQGPIPLNEQGQPSMTPKQFATKKLKDYAIQAAKTGHQTFAANAAFDAARALADADLGGA
jgi:hypothetical protein